MIESKIKLPIIFHFVIGEAGIDNDDSRPIFGSDFYQSDSIIVSGVYSPSFFRKEDD